MPKLRALYYGGVHDPPPLILNLHGDTARSIQSDVFVQECLFAVFNTSNLITLNCEGDLTISLAYCQLQLPTYQHSPVSSRSLQFFSIEP